MHSADSSRIFKIQRSYNYLNLFFGNPELLNPQSVLGMGIKLRLQDGPVLRPTSIDTTDDRAVWLNVILNTLNKVATVSENLKVYNNTNFESTHADLFDIFIIQIKLNKESFGTRITSNYSFDTLNLNIQNHKDV